MELKLTVVLPEEQVQMILDIHGKMTKQIAELKGRVRSLEGRLEKED